MSALRRTHRPELMDQPAPDPAQLAHSLADLRRVNRWLGGTRAVQRLLAPRLAGAAPGVVQLLDVATGSADIPLALTRWARARGIALRVTATDAHPTTLAEASARTASDPDIVTLPADARALPFRDAAFDYSLCCTALHHFAEDEAVTVLRELARVARRGVVVSDLRRSRAGLLGAQLLAATVWRRHPITRHDGPASVRGAFSAAELRELAAAAGWEGARVRTHPVFRVSLVLDRG